MLMAILIGFLEYLCGQFQSPCHLEGVAVAHEGEENSSEASLRAVSWWDECSQRFLYPTERRVSLGILLCVAAAIVKVVCPLSVIIFI